jgi:hypothetical protein
MAGLVLAMSASILLSSCGGGGQASTGGGVPAGGHAPAGRPVANSTKPLTAAPVTKARAVAFARAVSLTAADIPGASIDRVRARFEPEEKGQVSRCEGNPRKQPSLADVPSANLKRGSELESEWFRSYVTVLTRGRNAAPELSTFKSPSERECIARALTRRFAGRSLGEARWGRFSISPLPIQAPGAQTTVGFRVATTLSFTFSEITAPLYMDVFGFGSGPVAVGLLAVSGTQPVPEATEQRLISLLLARAKATAL